MAKHTFKILRCSHCKIFKVCLANFQCYAEKGKAQLNECKMQICISTFKYPIEFLSEPMPRLMQGPRSLDQKGPLTWALL